MVAFIGAILGVVTGVIPEIVGYFKTKEDNKHAIALLHLQMEATKQGTELTMALEELRADLGEGDSLRRHDAAISGGKFMDALRASVRPVITYCFFFLFAAVEISAIWFMTMNTEMNFVEIMTAIWDENTQGMFAAVLGFWFGSRMMEKFSNKQRAKYV